MTSAERAAQVWPLLVWAAKHRQTLTYGDVEKLTGLGISGVGRHALGPIKRYCENKGYPVLTSIVVKQTEGEPGEGIELDPKDVPAAQMRVFAFDWMDPKKAPELEDLEQ